MFVSLFYFLLDVLEAAVQAAGLGEAGDYSDGETSLMEEIDQAGEFPPTKIEARRALLAFASLLLHNKVADSSDICLLYTSPSPRDS